MWEKRIEHQGLRAYRVVRGDTQEEVERKAEFQLAQWQERWLKKVDLERSRDERAVRMYAKNLYIQNTEESKAVALERTRELETDRKVIEMVLNDAWGKSTMLNWESLMDAFGRPVVAPQQPRLKPLPKAPVREDFTPLEVIADALPPRTLWERINPRARRVRQAHFASELKKKEMEADLENARRKQTIESEFAAAKDAWDILVAESQAMNLRLQAHYDREYGIWIEQKNSYQDAQEQHNQSVAELKRQYLDRSTDAIALYCYEVLAASAYPDNFPREHSLSFVAETGALIVDFELPSKEVIPVVREVKYIVSRSEFQEVPASEISQRKAYEDLLYRICLRTLYELFQADAVDMMKAVVFNGWVRSIDKSTGNEAHACVLSVEANKQEFATINLPQVDPKACFKKLKGVSGSKLSELSPIRPIVVLEKEDSRFVPSYNVIDGVDDRTNLAAMDWLDFENLIREIFEKEFSRNGGEVKITQASRDGGVDAIAFDPDPIRGGKVVIQAKRYTNTVGVSAVRDLFGTVHNEGATKGILVTTSDFGPDAYEFVRGKPLTLLSGSELLYLLQRHGHRAKIDIPEAKRLAQEA